MEGGEEIIKARRTNEVLVESNQTAGVAVCKTKIKINDFLSVHSDFVRDESNNTLVVLAKYLAFPL